jgi:branched-chain amino acid transport system ATP-binding protein
MDQNPITNCVLSVRDVHAGYEGAEALRGVTLVVKEGETVVILGANGAGKTTLLMAISGIIPSYLGTIELAGVSLRGLKPNVIMRMGVAHVPEGRLIFPELTVAENLSLTARLRFDRRTARQQVEEVLEEFPRLRDRLRVAGGLLSGGEQQMMAIARALVTRPRLLLLDEPSLGLAPVVADQVFDLLVRIKSKGTTILLVEQNAELALALAERVYVMETGTVVLNELAESLRADARIADAYLGTKKQ